jgi:hypothetical protein
MGRYRFRKVEPLSDMPPITAPIEPEPSSVPVRAMAAVVFTKGGGLELRLHGCSPEDLAVIERVELVPWFHVEPEIIRNLRLAEQ